VFWRIGGHRCAQACADPTAVCRVLSPTVVAGAPVLVGRDEAVGSQVRRWGQRQEGLAQVVRDLRRESGARRGRWQVVLGGFGGCLPEHMS
jgi:hypothetical protein